MSVDLPHSKRQKILADLQKYSKVENIKIRDFAKLVGTLISSCPAVPYGLLYTKVFERFKTRALDKSNHNFEGYMHLNTQIYQDIEWWKKHIVKSTNSIKTYNFALEIYSDASTTGWGLYCHGKTAHGFWSESEKRHHINYLELLAASIGLKTFATDVHDCELLLRIDNTTAIAYVNKMGGTRFPHLNSLARDLWKWCEKKNIWIYASYIPSKENKADKESRRSCTEIDWELSYQAFNKIIAAFGTPDIDLFATRSNTKCHVYASWHRDPDAKYVDAFTINWSKHYFYAFPPFALILRTINKIRKDNGRGIMVVPDWPSQPWYPLFKRMAENDKIICFKPNPNLLLSPFRERHPLHKSLTLIASVLCGNR